MKFTLKEQLELRGKRDPETGCLNYRGWINTNGYGRIRIGKKSCGAHRVAYEVFIGPIPEGMLVCHKCDNRRCIEPTHLFLGTHADNTQDMLQKGRGQHMFTSKPKEPVT